MTTTSTPTNTASALPELVFADGERIALAGFLAGYRGLTRDAYALDLRQFVGWCERHELKLFAARRADMELYARYLEEAGRPGHRGQEALYCCRFLPLRRGGRARACLPGGPCAPAPARLRAPRRRPRPQRGGSARGGCRPRLTGRARSHLAARSERPSRLRSNRADIEARGLDRGHRTLTVLRKGGKVVTVPFGTTNS